MAMYSSAEHRKLVTQLIGDRKLNAITDRFSRMEHLVKQYSKKLIRHGQWVQAQCRAYEAEHQKSQSSAEYFLAKTDQYIGRLEETANAEAYDEAYGKMMEKSNSALRHLAYRWTDPVSMATLAKLYAKRAEVNLPIEQYALAKANLKLAYSAVLACQADKEHFQQGFDLQLLAKLVSLGRQLVLAERKGEEDEQEEKEEEESDDSLPSALENHDEALSLIVQLNGQLSEGKKKKDPASRGVFRLNSKLKLVSTGANGGRFYQATGHIAPNERILRDLSQSTTIFREHRFSYCDACHRSIESINGESIFWPCCGCTELAYCSASCAAEAYEQYHRFECGIYGLMVGDEDFYWMSHVYRHFVLFGVQEAMAAENEEVAVEYGSAEPFDLNEYINSEEQRSKPLKQLSASGRQLLCRAMAALESNRGKRTPLREHTNTVLSFCIVNFFFYKGVLAGGDLVDEMSKDSTAFSQLLENLSASMMRISTNGFCWADDISDDQFIRVASCVCLAASFLNHSCHANVTWSMGDGAQISMTATRAIEPGEALTTCYGPKEHHKFSDRQERLYNDYCFYCRCEVCLKDAANAVDTLQCGSCSGGGPLVQKPFHACLQCGQQGQPSVSTRLVGLVKEASAEFERIYRKLYQKKRGSLLVSAFKKLLLVAGQKKKKEAEEGEQEDGGGSDYVRKLMLQLEPEAECSLRLQKAILGSSGKAADAAASNVPIELNAAKFTMRRLYALEKELKVCAQLSYAGSYHLLEKYVALLKLYQDAGLAERGLHLMKAMGRSLQDICPSLTDASLGKVVALLDYANFFFESFALAYKDDIPRLMGGEEDTDDADESEDGEDGQSEGSSKNKGESLFWSTFQRFNSKLESILQYDIEHRGDFCPLYHKQLHQQQQEQEQDLDVNMDPAVPTADLQNELYFLQLYRESKRRAAFIEEAIATAD